MRQERGRQGDGAQQRNKAGPEGPKSEGECVQRHEEGGVDGKCKAGGQADETDHTAEDECEEG